MRKLGSSKQITLGAMVVSLTVLMLYAGAVLPAGKLACYFIASLFVYVLSFEGAYLAAVLSYIASSLLAFLLIPDKLSLLPFFALLGHFGIFKAFARSHIRDRFIRAVAYLIYCSVFTAIAALAAFYLLGFDIFESIPFDLPVYAAILILEAAFAVYALLYLFCQQFYETHIRNSLLSKK
ncbi:MAG: hypothetical protein ABFC62_05455 [Clostridiaceae bacterium]|nr:hypothetical protein [Eubacteriales bacterium]